MKDENKFPPTFIYKPKKYFHFSKIFYKSAVLFQKCHQKLILISSQLKKSYFFIFFDGLFVSLPQKHLNTNKYEKESTD